MAMAVKLFELERLTSGQAAQLAKLDRVQFILNLHQYGVSPVQATPEELAEDLTNAYLDRQIVIDTSPLLALCAAYGDFTILRQLYETVIVPYEVTDEILCGGSSTICLCGVSGR